MIYTAYIYAHSAERATRPPRARRRARGGSAIALAQSREQPLGRLIARVLVDEAAFEGGFENGVSETNDIEPFNVIELLDSVAFYARKRQTISACSSVGGTGMAIHNDEAYLG